MNYISLSQPKFEMAGLSMFKQRYLIDNSSAALLKLS
jgi:hypothetical protein